MTITLATIAIVATTLGAARLTTRAADLGFTVHYDGRGAEGLDDIWRGTLDRPGAGAIEIRVETMPGQPVAKGPAHAFVFVSRDTIGRSFGATTTGRIDGETVHLTGDIDVGKGSGAPIELTMRLDTPERLAGHGTIRVRPVRVADRVNR